MITNPSQPISLLDEIKQFFSCESPNNFDEYNSACLSSSKKCNYVYVGKIPMNLKSQHLTSEKGKANNGRQSHQNKKNSSSLLHQKNPRPRKDDIEMNNVMGVIDQLKINNHHGNLTRCLICNESFRKEMTIREKNAHINECIDNQAEKYRQSNICEKNYDEKSNLVKENSLKEKCPICGIFLSHNNNKRNIHINECLDKRNNQ